MPGDRVLLAIIGRAHGVRGEVRVKTFTADPAALADYDGLADETGRPFRVERLRQAKEVMVVKFAGVGDREAAEALNGLALYVDRAALPPAGEDEFYHADLIGLEAFGPDGASIGTVVAVHDHGAGDILEIAPRRGSALLVPFTRDVVPEVDLAGGRLTLVPPPETEATGEEDDSSGNEEREEDK